MICFVRVGVVRVPDVSLLVLLLLSVFILSVSVVSVDFSMGDAIKLGGVVLAMGAVGEMCCCGITGCLSCQGKQSTSSLLVLSLSSSGRSFSIILS